MLIAMFDEVVEGAADVVDEVVGKLKAFSAAAVGGGCGAGEIGGVVPFDLLLTRSCGVLSRAMSRPRIEGVGASLAVSSAAAAAAAAAAA